LDSYNEESTLFLMFIIAKFSSLLIFLEI